MHCTFSALTSPIKIHLKLGYEQKSCVTASEQAGLYICCAGNMFPSWTFNFTQSIMCLPQYAKYGHATKTAQHYACFYQSKQRYLGACIGGPFTVLGLQASAIQDFYVTSLLKCGLHLFYVPNGSLQALAPLQDSAVQHLLHLKAQGQNVTPFS